MIVLVIKYIFVGTKFPPYRIPPTITLLVLWLDEMDLKFSKKCIKYSTNAFLIYYKVHFCHKHRIF